MALTPLIMIMNDRLIQPRFIAAEIEEEADDIDDNENPVIIAGFGRFGQIVGRLLIANGFNATVLDHSPTQIDLLRRFGFKVFYGDASRIDLLHAAGARQARLFVVAIDDRERALHIVELVQKHFPHLKILARAIDRRHAYEFIQRGVEVVQRETFDAALEMGESALKLLGTRSYKAHRSARIFKEHDEQALWDMANLKDDTVRLARSQQLRRDLERVLQSDDQANHPRHRSCVGYLCTEERNVRNSFEF